jgi:hypothetical protein
MTSPRTDADNFPNADPVEPHAGIARAGVDGPTALARREELPYDDKGGIGILGVFFGALLLLALGLLFFGPRPSDTSVATSTQTEGPLRTTPQAPPSTSPKTPN